MVKDELSPTDAKFLFEFRKCSEDNICKKGINLCNRVKLTLDYYNEADRHMTTDNTKGNTKFIHGIVKLLFEFKSLYKEKKEFRGGLLCCFLHNCVEKLIGSTNPHYDSSSLNLSLALAANGNIK